jgi:hypothetical protein
VPNLLLIWEMSWDQYLRGCHQSAMKYAIRSRLSREYAPVVRFTVVGRARDVVDDGRDPDSVKAHVLDVVELAL